MSTDLILQIRSTSSEATERLAQVIGSNLRGGEIIELQSDLGGGKTTFTRGLVAGSGSNDEVASPTFTISRVYQALHFSFHHFDFYRLQEAGIVTHELEEVINEPDSVVVVEWANIVATSLPKERVVHILFEYLGETERNIVISAPKDYMYLFDGVEK